MNARTQDEVKGMARAGRAVREAFVAMRQKARPGITTAALDEIGAQVLERLGARSAPQLFYDFPGRAIWPPGPMTILWACGRR